MNLLGVISTAQGFSVEDWITQSTTSLYIIYDAPKYNIIWIESSDVIDSFISKILKYESSVIVSSTEKPWAVLITPKNN